MNIILSGPQGSGKGTQGKMLSDNYGFYHMENGKVLRTMAQTDDRIREMLNNGILVPDLEMIGIMENNLVSQKVGFDQIIFDGYPRSVSQYHALKSWLKEHGSKVDFAVLLEISEETTVERLSSRRIHKITGENYNLITKPPIGIPEADLIQRDDDKPEAIRKRLDMYNTETKPMIEEYKKDGILIEIDGERSIEEIYEEIVQKIGL